ncbi:sodium:solute symporter family protein [Acaryochloris marina]|uniref:sodium:solute symporter family protein n=1 Tax=Acaryochloris marina TaxID=155978 RepID=UPI001BAEDF07|nr:sodium:solute symporter family protein [Acaryochloris marina]QUY44172.1 sodium:solute symporter family protein [Acaryochloris marina S15]
METLIPYIAIATYLLITLGIGLIGYRQQSNTVEDFFLANRNIGPLLLFFTLASTNFSAFFFLGFAGAGYRIGISYYPMMAFGTGFAALSFYYIGYKAWLLGKQKGFITPSELIQDRLPSQPLKLLFMAVMVIFTLPYLTLQPIGAGYLLENLTGGAIPYFWGATLLTVAIVFYVFLGGMRSVALTDMLQGVLMCVLMLVAVFAIAQGLGGFSVANQTVYDLEPALFSRSGLDQSFTPKTWFSYICLWSFTLPMFPQMFMRFYSAKSAQPLKVSVLLYPIVAGVLFICPVLIGVWGHIAFPDLVGKAADQIFPMMLAKYTSTGLSSLVMVGALAAFMSTMDSQLLALSSMLTRDVYTAYFRKDASLAEQTLVGRIWVIVLAGIGLGIAANPPETILAFATQAFTGLSVLFPTVIAALYGRDISASSCLVSIVIGELAVLGVQTKVIPSSWMLGFLPVVPIVALSALIIIAGSAFSPTPAQQPVLNDNHYTPQEKTY